MITKTRLRNFRRRVFGIAHFFRELKRYLRTRGVEMRI